MDRFELMRLLFAPDEETAGGAASEPDADTPQPEEGANNKPDVEVDVKVTTPKVETRSASGRTPGASAEEAPDEAAKPQPEPEPKDEPFDAAKHNEAKRKEFEDQKKAAEKADAITREKAEAYAKNWLEKYKDNAIDALVHLLQENAEVRRKYQTSRDNELPEGAVIASPAELEELRTYRKLGTPAQIRAVEAERDAAQLERDAAKKEVAQAVKEKGDVLERAALAERRTFVFEAGGGNVYVDPVVENWPKGATHETQLEDGHKVFYLKEGDVLTEFSDFLAALQQQKPYLRLEAEQASKRRPYTGGAGTLAKQPKPAKASADSSYGVKR